MAGSKQSIGEIAMAGSNSNGFWGCQTHKAKAFSASKLPHRPHTAKIQVYSMRPTAKYRGNGYGWVQFSNSIPPQGFWGCETHTAKAFSASKLPHRPHTAKIQFYSMRPTASIEETAMARSNFRVLYPPRVFGGAKQIRPNIFSFQIAL